ncbi:acyl-CoA dehydratase activase [Thermodesulfobacteriota bacterium]
MIVAGIDIGHKSVNVVILQNDVMVGHATHFISGEVGAAAKTALLKTLDQVEIAENQVHRLFATGVGREKITFVDGYSTEMLAHALGAHRIFPAVRTVIDIGAEGSRVLRCDPTGNLTNFALNDKCASGTGVFLETVAGMLGVSLPEMGSLSLLSSKKIVLTATCAVFAESEIVAEIHRGSAKEDILRGVNESIVSKIATTSKRVGVEPDLVLTGGVALNIGVVKALEEQLGMDIKVAETPEIVGAIGAAIMASNISGEG